MTTTFEALGVSRDLAAALAVDGIIDPFPVQTLCIPDGLAGRDICGRAKTGSGKTLAFGLPLIERTKQARPRRPRALVLAPTRELAVQTARVLGPLAAGRDLVVRAIYGGTSMNNQIDGLRRRVDVVVATPGRLIDLIERKAASLSDVSFLVIDEADRMADMGFLPQLDWILGRMTQPRQTMLFSATLGEAVERIVKRIMRDPVHHEVESITVEEMEHLFLAVHQMDKVKVAAGIARHAAKTLLFVRTKRGAERLVTRLRGEGVRAGAIHGDLSQKAREMALRDFSSGKVAVMVATDVAARGLDVDGVEVVLHYDPPSDHTSYLHRSGRTARAGEKGVAATLVLWDQVEDVKRIQRRVGIGVPIVEVFSNDPRLADLGAWDAATLAV